MTLLISFDWYDIASVEESAWGSAEIFTLLSFKQSLVDESMVKFLPITFILIILSHSILQELFHSEYTRNVLIANQDKIVLNSPRDCAK